MQTILVTGSDGQLGQELQGLSYTHKYNRFKFFFTRRSTLDITDPSGIKQFIRENSINCIINCAAYTDVDRAESEKEQAMLVNAGGTENLVDACAENNVRLIFISTDYVFDGNVSVPYLEEHAANPLSVYGKTKLEGEKAVLKYEYGTIIRTSWLYSPYRRNFFKTILSLGSERDHLDVVFDQVGTPTYARDLAGALLMIADVSLTEKGLDASGIFHYSNEGVCSWYDFAYEIVKSAGLRCYVNPIETHGYPVPAKRPCFSVLNKSKIKSAFSIKIPHWRESLLSCID